MSVIHWMKRQGPFNKQASQAKLEVVIDSLKGGHSKEQRGMHSLAQQCLVELQSIPGRTLTPSAPPSSKDDPILGTFMPMYKERIMQGASETEAKGGIAAQATVASMMTSAAFFTEHKSRVFENAIRKAQAGEGSKQPPVVQIHAVAAMYAAPAKKNTRTQVAEVPLMVLCEWEGCGSADIDDEQLTWQPEAHFHDDWLRKHMNVLVEFKEWFASCRDVQKRKLTWPLSKEKRKEVVCKPGFEWVAMHPSLKMRLKFK